MSEGRQLALDTGCKYIEVSCTFAMNIDVLLAGISSQLGQKNNITNVKGSKNSKYFTDNGKCHQFLLIPLNLFNRIDRTIAQAKFHQAALEQSAVQIQVL